MNCCVLRLRTLLLLCLVGLLSSSPAFSQYDLDSLWSVWQNEKESNSARSNALFEYAWEGYIYANPDSTFILAQLLVEFGEQVNDDVSIAKGYFAQGSARYINGETDEAIRLLKTALQYHKKADFKQGQASTYNNIGLVHLYLIDYDSAIYYFSRSREIQEEIGDLDGVSRTSNNLAIIYVDQGDYVKGIENYMLSLEIAEENLDVQGQALTCNNIGAVYSDQDDYEKAKEFYRRAVLLSDSCGDFLGKGAGLNGLADIAVSQGNTKKAMELAWSSYQERAKLVDTSVVAESYQTIADIYYDLASYDTAALYYRRAIAVSAENTDPKRLARSYEGLARIALTQGEYDKGIALGRQAWVASQEIGVVGLTMNNAKVLSELYEITNQPDSALIYFRIYVEARDSISDLRNRNALIRQEMEYAYAQQLAEGEAATQRAELESEQRKVQSYYLFGGLGLTVLFGLFIFNRFRITRKQRDIIESQKEKVDDAYLQLEIKNKEVLDSITYAKRIQGAILPSDKLVKQYLADSFIFYKPKDIVAGDFYWMHPTKDGVLFAAADCTGHGVPGAMVSVVCNNGLNRAVREFGLEAPGMVLDKTRELVIEEFEKSEDEVNDGMDIALCHWSAENNILRYAGANNPLWVIRKTEDEVWMDANQEPMDLETNTRTKIERFDEHLLLEIKASKQPIGQFVKPLPYQMHELTLQAGDTIYLFSDGYVDQFGGVSSHPDKPGGKKFKARSLKKLLVSLQPQPLAQQHESLDAAFEAWKGDLEQIDDVCVIGVRV